MHRLSVAVCFLLGGPSLEQQIARPPRSLLRKGDTALNFGSKHSLENINDEHHLNADALFWERLMLASVGSMESDPTPSPESNPSDSTNTPSPAPSLPVCTGATIPFQTSVLLDLEGQIGLATDDDIALLEEVLRDAYNQVALCDQEGSFIRVTEVASGLLFSDGNDESTSVPGTCRCDFPLVETYILACNELIGNQQDLAGSFNLLRVTTLAFIGGSGVTLPITSFSSQISVGGTATGFIGGFDLTLILQATLEVYNSVNILNFANCDSAVRNVISVQPNTVDQRSDASPDNPMPFSIVFNFIGTCRGCGTSTVVFGSHSPSDPVDSNVVCPTGSVLRCPSEEEFRMELEAAIERIQQEGDVAIVDSIESVVQISEEEPTPMPSGCVDSTGEPTASAGAAVDLSMWTVDTFPGGTSSWNIASDNNSVLQTINGFPSVFCSDFKAFGNELAGIIAVETSSDDDFIGFVLGYETGDFDNLDADYLLVDWKQNNQGGSRRGFAVSQITGTLGGSEFWEHLDDTISTGSIEELARGATLGDTGWVNFVEYSFRFTYTPSNLQVFVDGSLQIDISGSFPDGKFCFYNYSQERVRYSGITQRSLPEPEILCPSSSPSVQISAETPTPVPSPSLCPPIGPGIPEIFWTDWETSGVIDGVMSYLGTMNVTRPNGESIAVTVTFSGAIGINFFQTGWGTDYFADIGRQRDIDTSPYTSGQVTNIPPPAEMISLRFSQRNTLTFTDAEERPVEIANLVFAFVSLNGNAYAFDQDFDILSLGGVDGNTCGYFGCGTATKEVVTVGDSTEYRLVGTGGEPHGTIQYNGAFSTVTWQSLSDEFWNGFTVGVPGLAEDIIC